MAALQRLDSMPRKPLLLIMKYKVQSSSNVVLFRGIEKCNHVTGLYSAETAPSLCW